VLRKQNLGGGAVALLLKGRRLTIVTTALVPTEFFSQNDFLNRGIWRPKAFRVGTRLWLGSKRWRFFEGQLPDDVTKAFLTAEVSP
jgi:hypothetical protein